MAIQPKSSWHRLGAATLLTLPLVAYTLAQNDQDPSQSESEIKPRADKSLLLDVARTDSGYVAVGERGHVLLSDDGLNWKQVSVPTRSTLTTVSAQGDLIWAAGHDGVILHSSDAGKSWQRQRAQPWSADSQELTNGSPIIDSLFVSATEGYMVGAYSMLLKTVDGGATWNSVSVGGTSQSNAPVDMTASDSGVFDDSALALSAESDPHLNAIQRTESGVFLVMGERGAGFRSSNNGETWSKIRLPYAGSMFGVLSLGGESVLAYGLRGNVFQSDDAGNSWRKIESGTDISLLGGTVDQNGRILLVGSNGTMLSMQAGQSVFSLSNIALPNGQTPALSNAIASDNGYLLTSDLGTVNHTVP